MSTLWGLPIVEVDMSAPEPPQIGEFGTVAVTITRELEALEVGESVPFHVYPLTLSPQSGGVLKMRRWKPSMAKAVLDTDEKPPFGHVETEERQFMLADNQWTRTK